MFLVYLSWVKRMLVRTSGAHVKLSGFLCIARAFNGVSASEPLLLPALYESLQPSSHLRLH